MPKFIAILAIASMILPPQLSAAITYSSCAKVAAKIEKVQRKMRLGYTAKQGEKLKSRLRKLKKQRIECERQAEKFALLVSLNSYLA